MVDFRPLRGVRFNPDRAGPVGPLIAPPYDVESASGAAAEFSIRNIEGVDLGRKDGDHQLAAQRYRDWLDRGVLVRDVDPSIYVHRHQFLRNEFPVLRTGILGRVHLTDWSDRIVLPHEETTAGPREERRQRLRAVGANLSPLYFLYRDPDGEIRELISSRASGRRVPDGHDQMGGLHDLLPVPDSAFHEQLSRLFASRTLFVADGHHRYEAALAYRNECREKTDAGADAPFEFVLGLLAAVEDPGVIVRPTHRLLRRTVAISPESMLATIRAWFEVRPAETAMPPASDAFVCRVVLPGCHGTWDLYALPGRPHIHLVPGESSSAWRLLDVVAVQGVIEHIIGSEAARADSHVIPVVDDIEAALQVERGDAQAAFILAAPSLDRLLAVAEEGELLPPKSTWFEPKAPAGLVINDLSS